MMYAQIVYTGQAKVLHTAIIPFSLQPESIHETKSPGLQNSSPPLISPSEPITINLDNSTIELIHKIWIKDQPTVKYRESTYLISLLLFVYYGPLPTTRDAVSDTIVAGGRARIRLNIEVNINYLITTLI